MGHTFIDLIKMFFCRFFGHVQGTSWEHQGMNSLCKRCYRIYKSGGHYKLRSFKEASTVCGIGESIHRCNSPHKIYAKNHNIPLYKRVPMLDKLSKDWIIFDSEY